MEVRAAGPSDLPAVERIYAHHVAHGVGSFELEPPSLPELRRRFHAIRELGLPYLVAAEEKRILGYAYAGPYRPRPAYRFTVEDSIYVSPEAQRRGVGGALLGALLAELGGTDIRQVVAVIGDSGNAASIRLHAAAGFRRVGVLKAVGWKHGRWLDTVLMQLELGSGR